MYIQRLTSGEPIKLFFFLIFDPFQLLGPMKNVIKLHQPQMLTQENVET